MTGCDMSEGFTLLELLVTIAIVAIVASVTGISLASLRTPESNAALAQIEQARADAVRLGKPIVVRHDGRSVRFLPDGSSSGGWLEVDGVWFNVSPLTGEISALR